MGKTRDLIKKIKGPFHAKMGTIKDKNGMDLTEVEDIRRDGKHTQSSVQFSSVPQSCPTLCNLVDCSMPGSSVQGFPRLEYWSRLPFPSPRDLPSPGIIPGSPALAG